MTRKVSIEAEVLVMVPVLVKVDTLIRSDEGCNHNNALQLCFSRGKMRGKLYDVEETKVEDFRLQDVPEIDEDERTFAEKLEEHLSDLAEAGALRGKVIRSRVTDSR